MRITFALFIFLVARPGIAVPISPVQSEIRQKVEQILAGVDQGGTDQSISSSVVLPAFYEQRAYRPAWTNPQAVQQLIQTLQQVDADGLRSDDYHLASILMLQENTIDESPEVTARRDMLMTDALIRLGYHLLAGKVDAQTLDSNWNMTRTIGDLDTILAMGNAIETAHIPQMVDALRPDHRYYAVLRKELSRYRAIRDQGGWPPVPQGPVLKPGMTDARIPVLSQRLAVTGELKAGYTATDTYDATLEAAVKRFQEHHALTPDGVLGVATLEAMNFPVQARINQIKINLERARWVLHDLPEDVVLTDIAGFKVSYFRTGAKVWSTRAQVGKPYRKTPVFKDRIRYLEVNPTWTVPPTILKNDILPKIAADPDYLRQKDMIVLTHGGELVDPDTVDWGQYPENPFPYLLRQNPGPNNALGRIKFMFPNKHAVYLHDTPSRSLFDRDQRAFSSGCIRVQDPFKFAELLLDDPQWTSSRIEEIVASKQTTRIDLSEPVTVILLYWTVSTTSDGNLIFKQDIYDRDEAVLMGLNEPFRFRDAPILEEK